MITAYCAAIFANAHNPDFRGFTCSVFSVQLRTCPKCQEQIHAGPLEPCERCGYLAGQTDDYIEVDIRELRTKAKLCETPIWSPDGQYIAFAGRLPSKNYSQIFLADTLGQSENLELTGELKWEGHFVSNNSPTWSPSGQVVACSTNRTSEGVSIDTYSLNTKARLNYLIKLNIGSNIFDWSRTGNLLVFDSFRDSSLTSKSERQNDLDIYSVPITGATTTAGIKNATRLTDADGERSEGINWGPRISPDGSIIAYTSFRNGNSDIYVMNVDGTKKRCVVSHSAVDQLPTWSPDGKRIAFQSNRSGNMDIYSVQLDGANLRRMTSNRAQDTNPCWSPDGQYMAFQSDRNGDSRIFIIRVKR